MSYHGSVVLSKLSYPQVLSSGFRGLDISNLAIQAYRDASPTPPLQAQEAVLTAFQKFT
jgi:hypothetical protein